MVLPGSTPVPDLDELFRADRALRGVVIKSPAGPSLLTRDQLQATMSGRLGFGRALNVRSDAAAMVPPAAFTLAPGLGVQEAVEAILERPEETRYQDVLVLAPAGPRIVPVSEIFEALSAVFRHASLHDPLTGLPNRRMLELWAPALTRDNTNPTRVGVIFIDLDDFKGLNDTYGHRTGDAVLSEFAARLSRCIRPQDTIVRLGGDEFAVLLVGVDEHEAGAVADRALACMDEHFVVDDHHLDVTATLGLAMAGDVVGDEALTHLDALLRHADGAMLHAKKAGKGRVGRICTGGGVSGLAREALIRRQLPHALDSGAFTLHYQPLLDLRTGECRAVEALLRWSDPDLGLVGPAEFIPLAEHTGEIHRIGRWVIDQTCAQGKAWLSAGTPRRIAVNVSPSQFAAGTLARDIRDALHRNGLPAAWLEIEITEGTALADVESAAAQLRELIEAGIGVALDDYGTAYSNLALIRDLPLTNVKIDGSFIKDIDTSPFAEALVGGLISSLQALGLPATAEGVERRSQLDVLSRLGCHTAQGYLISRPIRAAEIEIARFDHLGIGRRRFS